MNSPNQSSQFIADPESFYSIKKNTERRTTQNRAAQRAFRARKEAYIHSLENQVASANLIISELELQVNTLKAQLHVYQSNEPLNWAFHSTSLERRRKNMTRIVRETSAKLRTEMDDYFAEHLLFQEKLQIVLQTQDEKGLEWINTTIDKYQENPALLDPHLKNITTPLVQAIKKLDKDNSIPFKILYSICKTRGYKTVLKFFSHSVSDLEPVLEFTQNLKSDVDWEVAYICLLWLSLIILIPFDLKKIDSQDQKISMTERILSLSRTNMNQVGRIYEAASNLWMRSLSRHDVANIYLQREMDWAWDLLQTSENMFVLRGVLTGLCMIYKTANRNLMLGSLSKSNICFQIFEKSIFQSNSLLRKLLVKLVQRVGLVYMRPRIASWRYKRGHRSLQENLAPSKNVLESKVQKIEDNYDDIPEVLEDILDLLLRSCNDKDTVVRWSAAKGIGRITNRLPKDLADDVLVSVISQLEEDAAENGLQAASDSTWHGACLALAELSRRGLLLPERLKDIMPLVIMALTFDQRKGSHSIGAHVRDSACYVCWAFARAYEPAVMRPFVDQLAESLVVLSVFDREVNIRRASSAAFQENVGRQGTFPHGIAILTAADYFSIGNRSKAFLDVSIEIAQFPNYRKRMIDYLVNTSCRHWDKGVRELCSQALFKFTTIDPKYMIDFVIDKLIRDIKNSDLVIRHGSLLAIGEIARALPKEILIENPHLVESIGELLLEYPAEYLECFGSDLNRFAICRYIECMAQANWPVNKPLFAVWIDMLETSLGKKDELLQNQSALAIGAISVAYSLDDALLQHFLKSAGASDQLLGRRGYTLIIGELSPKIMESHPSEILDSISKASQILNVSSLNDVETRKNALNSLSRFLTKGNNYPKSIYVLGLDILLNSFEDYTIDARGDVGSWVREAAMKGIECFLFSKSSSGDPLDFFSEEEKHDFSRKLICKLSRQSVERIDRVRDVAGRILNRILWCLGCFPVMRKSELQAILPENLEISWLNPSEVFPVMIQMVDLEEYRLDFYTGMVASMGGIAETLVRNACSCLLDYLGKSNTKSRVESFLETLIIIYKTYEQFDRISIPYLEVLDIFLGNPSLIFSEHAKLYDELVAIVQKIAFKSRDVKKLKAAIKVYSNLASLEPSNGFEGLVSISTKKLVGYLSHPFPLVRRMSSEYLHMAISSRCIDETVEFGEVEDLLLNTDWDGPLSGIKSVKEQISLRM